MGIISLKSRRLLLPSVLVLGAILALSVLLSALFYPDNIQGNSPAPLVPATATPTPSPTAFLNVVATATSAQVASTTPVPSAAASLTNCTYTTFYWQTFPERWVIQNIVIGDSSFTQAEAVAILSVEASDERTFLLQQFFAALLNTLKGTDSKAAEGALINAGDWLNAHPEGVEISTTDGQKALDLAAVLAQYNNGDIGPGHCPDEPVTPTPTPSPSPTATETPTASPISTFKTPTDVPRPGDDNGGKPTATQPAPTDQPTDEPTVAPPTNTPRPQPTDPPRPTPSPAPTAQPTPTEPPPTEAPIGTP